MSPRNLNGEIASRGHGVARVHHKIHDHLLELRGIGAKANRLLASVEVKANIFAEDAAKQLHDAVEMLLDVDHARFEHLLAAEGQQLAREGAAAGRKSVGL